MTESNKNALIEQIIEQSQGFGIEPILPVEINHVDSRDAVRRRFKIERQRLKEFFKPTPKVTSEDTASEEDEPKIFKDKSQRRLLGNHSPPPRRFPKIFKRKKPE